MKTIILKFSSPLQSWGIGSHFESRDTSRYPSKSAVIGLIGGALGYRRHETDKIKKLNELSFGVRIDQEGSLLKDFHIARSVNQTYVTDRYYLEDAIFLVLLSHEDDCFIEIISKALNNPVFPPYLGRRSIPVNNDFFQEVIDSEILTVIKSYKWLASDWYRKKQISQRTDNIIRLDAYLDANLIDDGAPPMFNRDRVESFDMMNRRHGFRPVKSMQVKIPINDDSEHDALKGIGGL